MTAKTTMAKRGGGGGGIKITGTTNPGYGPAPGKDETKIIGMGWEAGARTPMQVKADIAAMFKEAMSCSDASFMPTVAEVEWEIDGPMTPEEVESTLGAQISLLSAGSSVAGVQNVYTTPGLVNGQFQTYNLVTGIGVQVRVSPANFTAKGGALNVPGTGTVGPIVPDDWTRNDLLNGALGLTWDGGESAIPMLPATMNFNQWMVLGLAAFIKGFNLRWTYGTLVNIFEDQLANTAFLSAMGGGSGDSQLDIVDMVQRMNAFYESNGSTRDFLPMNAIRTGSANQGAAAANIGTFAGFDGSIVDVNWGGPAFQTLIQSCCGNSPFRMLQKPYLLNPGVPPGLIFEESNTRQANLFRRYMDITMGQASGVVPPVLTAAGEISPGWTADAAFTHAGVERTLDNPPAFVSQRRRNDRAEFKYTDGAYIAIVLLGNEISRGVAKCLENDPEVLKYVRDTCGCEVGWTS